MQTMINIVLFDEKATVRIAKKAMEFFSDYNDLRTTDDTIWLNGLYLKFCPRLIKFNLYNCTKFPIATVDECLKYILDKEEVFLSNERGNNKYVNTVVPTAYFDVFSRDCMV